MDSTEQLKQSQKEKVREILEPLDGVSDILVSDDSIAFSKGAAKRVITRDAIDLIILDTDCKNTYTHQEYLGEYDESKDEVLRAVCELIHLMQSTPDQPLTEQPGLTLEEAVKRHVAIVGGAKVVSVDEKNSVAYVRYARYKYAITPDLVFLLDQEEYPQATPVKEYHKKAISETWRDGVEGIAAELSKHFTKPSREELSEKVAQLTGESYGLIPESRVKDTINEGFRSLISIEDGYGGCSASEAESDVKHCRQLVASQEAILEDLTRKINQEKSKLKRLNGALEEAENVLEMARTIEQAIAGWRKTLQVFEEHTAPQEA